MVELDITAEHLAKANKMSREMGHLNNSITGGKGNIAGFLGEILLCEMLYATHENTYEYDIVLTDGSTVDVKTKRTTVEPKPYYECSVAALNTTQKCKYYAFMRVKNDYSQAWFLGMMPKERYFEVAKFLEKGDIDPDNNFVVKSDCYNLAIRDVWEECDKEFNNVEHT